MSEPAVPRAVVNAWRDPNHVPPAPDPEARAYHRSLPGFGETPLRDLPDVARELGVGAVWLKDESQRLGLSSFKILGASWATERTLRARPDVHTLVTASAGNHGLAVARVAGMRGLRARIYLPARTIPVRAARIEAEGAEVVRVPAGYEEAVAHAETAAREPGVALIADVAYRGEDDDAPGWVSDGYATLFEEAAEQAPGPIDTILVPIGVGALAAAAVTFAARRRPAARVVGVEPTTAACVTASLAAGERVVVPTPGTTMAGLDCATPSAVAWPVLRACLHGSITVGDDETADARRELAGLALAIGACGAAPLAALRALHTDPRCGALREQLSVAASSSFLLIGSEGPTGDDAPSLDS